MTNLFIFLLQYQIQTLTCTWTYALQIKSFLTKFKQRGLGCWGKTFSFTSEYVVFCRFDRIRSALSPLSHLFRMSSLSRLIPWICVFPTLRLFAIVMAVSHFLCLFTTFTRSYRVKYFIFFVDSIIPILSMLPVSAMNDVKCNPCKTNN